MVNSWSSGTGFAGVGGASLYLLLSGVGLSNQQAFLLCLPSVTVYLAAYFLLIRLCAAPVPRPLTAPPPADAGRLPQAE